LLLLTEVKRWWWNGQVVVECIPRMRHLLEKESSAKGGGDVHTSRLFYLLSGLFRAARTFLASPDPKRRELVKAIVPLLKDFVRPCLQLLPRSVTERVNVRELSELAHKATIPLFIDSLSANASWGPFLAHADAHASALELEDRSAVTVIARQRKKTLLAVLHQLDKDEAAELSTDRYLPSVSVLDGEWIRCD
jgi:hypothetical protein